MKKSFLILLFIHFIALNCFSQTINEGFEGTFPPTGWSKQNTGLGSGWSKTTVGTTPIPNLIGGTVTACPNGLLGMAYCTYATGAILPDTISNQLLITPQIPNVTTNFALNFWLAKYGDYNENIQVLVSKTGNQISDFTDTIATIIRNDADSGWINYNYSLSAYANQNIYIAFREFVGNTINEGAFISLDNVQVGASISVDELSSEIYTNLYPIPATNSITLESSDVINKIYIVNLIGQVVIEKNNDSKSIKVNVLDLKPGIYFATMQFDKGKITKRFIVK